METIKIEHESDARRLDELGVWRWPIWEKDVSTFPWYYDRTETCYLLEGEVVVTPKDGNPVCFGRGDLVTLARGLHGTWTIRQLFKKHYTFD